MSKWPACFPDDFEANILSKEAKFESTKVYRLARFGVTNRDSYLSTIEEQIKYGGCGVPLRPQGCMNLKKAKTYSTSCSTCMDFIVNMLELVRKDPYTPNALIASGITEPSCGPSMAQKNGHVNWWVFDNSDPCPFFEEVFEIEQ